MATMTATMESFEAQGGTRSMNMDTIESMEVDIELGGASESSLLMINEHDAVTEYSSSLEVQDSSDTAPVDNRNNHTTTTTVNDGRPSLTRGMSRSSKWGGGVSQKHLLRTSTTVNLSTGQQGTKETVVEERLSHQEAMNPTERMLEQWLGGGGSTTPNNEDEASQALPKQYRLTARPTPHNRRRTCMECITGTRDDCDEYNVTVGTRADYLTLYLRWTFRTSFTMLLIFSCACFMLLSCAFALAIHVVGTYQPICINVGGKDYTDASFMDAYALSWTTLSTVGYGHVYPNLAFREGPRCLLINMFCTFEAFVGVLFAGFMGAILVGKVARVQSFAPTTFSDPIVVRYGTGLKKVHVEMDDCSDATGDGTSSSKASTTESPFPVLEFRVVNRMHSVGGGEIMNCTLNVVASVLEREASKELQQSALHKSHRAGRVGIGDTAAIRHFATGTAKQVGRVAGTTVKQVGKVTGTTKLAAGTARQVGQVAGAVTSGVTHVAGTVAGTVGTQAVKVKSILKAPLVGMEREDSSPTASSPLTRSVYAANNLKSKTALVDEGSDLAPRRIFSNLEVETPAHPFFKRVWNIQHVLDQTSPLLSAKAKQMIADNGGYWPEALNTYQAIRENLHFHEIIVNLSGTCNATGNVVYCQKVYSFVDVNIGYTFVRVLHRRDNGKLGVDVTLLNDVVEQNGGGGEPFTDVHESDLLEAAVDAAEKVATTAQTVAGRTQEQVVDATQNVADRTKEKVVHFKDMTVDMVDRVVTVGEDMNEVESDGSGEAPQESTQSGAKKTV